MHMQTICLDYITEWMDEMETKGHDIATVKNASLLSMGKI